jgi:hypothetical protein
MDSKSADDIRTAIADIATLKLRLTALENILRKRDPALLEAWSKETSNLASEMPYQMLPLALENLKKRLESE